MEIGTEKVTVLLLVGTENQNEAAVHQRENLNQNSDNECGKYIFSCLWVEKPAQSPFEDKACNNVIIKIS